uniref:Putative ovule protein n=1 Tax=Solanum chacoense TaxID=4108 RepID=A0A0V0HSX8_SOLCH
MDETTIVFYSVCTGLLLLYDLEKENLINEEELHHPDLKLVGLDWFKQYAGGKTLYHIAIYVKAVVCDSTLYWLNNDLRLYGYDYVRKEWFRSNSLELSWPLCLDPDFLVYAPRLFCLSDNTFVAICRVTPEELGMAIIEVMKEPPSLSVSLKFSHKFPVDTSDDGVDPDSGMAIWKDQRSNAWKKKI